MLVGRLGKPVERETRRMAGAGLWKDPRLAPFLIYGFLVATCQTAQGYTLGFMIIDRLTVSPV